MPSLPKPLIFSGVETLKISIFPKENQYFSGFCEKHVFAIFMFFSFQKSSKNLPGARSKPWKNRCRKRVDFKHQFLRFWPRFWRVLGLQIGAKLGYVGLKNFDASSGFPSQSCPKLNVLWKRRLGRLRARFWMPRGSILEASKLNFKEFFSYFGNAFWNAITL